MRYQHCGPANLPAISMEAFKLPPDSARQIFNMKPQFLDITLDEARNLIWVWNTNAPRNSQSLKIFFRGFLQ
jgi:hypothetical protein